MNSAHVSDLGPEYIRVTAPTAREAFDAALAYVATAYPDRSFEFAQFSTGVCGGAIVTGAGVLAKAV